MKQGTTAKDFFLHLGAITALYTASVSLINLLFQVINLSFPDRLDSYIDPYSGSLRWAIAMLVIAFPVYLLLSWFISKNIAKDPEKLTIWVRRWLSYLTLFIAGVTIAIDLVTLVNNFLGGELSNRFGFKVLVVFVVAGLIFSYYFLDLRRKAGSASSVGKIFAMVSALVVIGSLVYGFSVMGSPGTARALRFDSQRSSDLSTIQWQVVDYWQRTGKLPADLAALTDSISGYIPARDPETGAPYEYAVVPGNTNPTFKLCADFALDAPKDVAAYPMYSKPVPVGVPSDYDANYNNWNHKSGKQCFERTIDPSRYPPRKQ